MALHPFFDLDEYIRLPRLGSIALSPDGARLIATVQAPNADVTEWTTSLWEVDPEGERPARRLTRGVEGDALASITADGRLLFTSKRTLPKSEDSAESMKAIWMLPERGEAFPIHQRDGGWSAIIAAPESDVVLLGALMHEGVDDDDADASKRSERRKKKISAILHTTAGVRYWDHDTGLEHPRLRMGRLDGDEIVDVHDLSGDVGNAIRDVTLSRDGSLVAASWMVKDPCGNQHSELMLFDVANRSRRRLSPADTNHYGSPVFTPDGTKIAAVVEIPGTETNPPRVDLVLFDVASSVMCTLADKWDRWGTPSAFSPDGHALYVTADEDGECPVFEVNVVTGQVRRLTDRGAFASVQISPDGKTLYAVRTAYDCPGEIVAIDLESGRVSTLPGPVQYPALPGRLERVETTTDDGIRVPGWLVLPDNASADNPAPLTLWVHGGPMNSWNGWSWRWCPWLLASRGQAVLLPDPALSTGYGSGFIARGWGRWGAEPFTDIMAITDAIESRPEIRRDQTVMMGGSFGGYMANWIATQTDRFKAIVSHASLWNLEAFMTTTDGPNWWREQFTPPMLEKYSPHRFADQIVTPMLVIHGDKDYRVPIGEGLALWWALTGSHAGPVEDVPHQFLYFPDENHWILTPQHAKVWYETVIEFAEANRDGRRPVRPALL